jgi:D-alanyl-D-alanine carboxypeptidase
MRTDRRPLHAVLLLPLVLFVGLAALGAADALQVTTTQEEVEEIRQAVLERFETLETPGAVYGLFSGDDHEEEILLLLGHADEDKTRPIRRDDHFRVASVSKTFIGVVILQLVDEGKLKLSDPVAKYVDGVPRGDEITIEMLGFHRSGIPNMIASRTMQAAINENPTKVWTTKEILEVAFEQPLRFEPGERFDYSNTNTVLLGEVISRIAGKHWHEVVKERIYEPLGLENTGLSEDGTVPEPTPRGYRFGKEDSLIRYGTVWFDATEWNSTWAGAAGNLYSTLDDVKVFIRAVARGELLSEQSHALMQRWQEGEDKSVAAGFQCFRIHGAFGTLGDVPGFSVIAAYVPERDLTVVCLANLTATSDKLTAAAELGELTLKRLQARHE